MLDLIDPFVAPKETDQIFVILIVDVHFSKEATSMETVSCGASLESFILTCIGAFVFAWIATKFVDSDSRAFIRNWAALACSALFLLGMYQYFSAGEILCRPRFVVG